MRKNTSVCKPALYLILAALGLLVSACADRTEISDLTVVVGLGIDRQEDEVAVTAQVRKTAEGAQAAGGQMGQGGGGGGGGGGGQYTNLHARGKTVEEAVQELRRTVPRRLYFAHNTVVVFGARYARNGIEPALDYLLRNREFRRTQLFCVTSGTASDVLKGNIAAEQVNALGLQRLLLPEDVEFYVVKTTEAMFMNELLSPSRVPMMSWVDVERGKVGLKGVALFRGDRLGELLPTQLAQSLYLLRGETQSFTVNLPCNEPNRKSMIRIRFLRHQLRPTVKGDNVSFHVQVRGSGEPVTICRGDYLDPKTVTRIEQKINRDIEQRLRQVVNFMQKRRLDGGMFGSAVYRTDPQWWRAHAREWPRLFARVPVTIESRIELTRPGMFTTTPKEHYTPELFPPEAVGGDRR